MKRILEGFKAIGNSLTLVGHLSVITPLFAYLVFKVLVTITYINTPKEPFTSFWAFFVKGLSGTNLTHYPNFLLNMGTILSNLDIVFDVFVLVIAEAMTILLVSSLYNKNNTKLGESFSKCISKYPPLVGGALFSSIVLFIVISLPSLIFRNSLFTSSTRGALAGGLVGLLVQPLIIFITPFIIINKMPLISAIASSVRLGVKYYIEGLVIVTIPFLISLPITLLEMKTTLIAFRLSPEFLVQLQFAGEIIEFISLYILIGGTTILFVKSTSNDKNKPQQNTA